tara:strand:+ start:55 stop:858 length:804 start_codon:yes stop_codon:yes gene_type:complete
MAPALAIPALYSAGKFAMGKLPLLMATGAALPSLRQGRPVEAALQGGLGYLGGSALAGPASKVLMAGSRKLPAVIKGVAPGLVKDMSPAALRGLATGVTGLGLGAGALALGGASNQLAGQTAQQVGGAVGGAAQVGAGVIGYTAEGKPVYSAAGGAVPPGMGQYGPTDPYGSPLDVLGPAGMGQRLQTLKDAQTQRDVFRTLVPEVKAVTDAMKKEDFERNMAAAGIRQNIRTRAEMQRAAQDAGLRAGLGALQQAGQALTQTYQYS